MAQVLTRNLTAFKAEKKDWIRIRPDPQFQCRSATRVPIYEVRGEFKTRIYSVIVYGF
jgi:hypothetical protein